MRRVHIRHETRYAFSTPVQLGLHRLLLHPRMGAELAVETFRLETSPPSSARWLRDVFDNAVTILEFQGETTALAIRSEAIVSSPDAGSTRFLTSDAAAQYPFAYEPEDAAILLPFFSNASEAERNAAHAWASQFYSPGQPVQTAALLETICNAISYDFAYKSREEPGVQTAMETLARGVGSCRDFANLMIEAARALGLAARFVSGYRLDPTLPRELAATHAWVDVFIPGQGWRGFDPTIGGEATSHAHIPAAVARSPTEAPPVAGSFYGPAATSTLQIDVDVSEIVAP